MRVQYQTALRASSQSGLPGQVWQNSDMYFSEIFWRSASRTAAMPAMETTGSSGRPSKRRPDFGFLRARSALAGYARPVAKSKCARPALGITPDTVSMGTPALLTVANSDRVTDLTRCATWAGRSFSRLMSSFPSRGAAAFQFALD